LLVKADSANLIERGDITSQTYDDIKIESLFSFFQAKHDSFKDLAFWKESHSQGRYWIWGCGTKGVLLLFHMKESFSDYYSPVGCIDNNPAKQSKYLASLGYKVMNPEFLYRSIQNGDTIIVPNPAYLAEINSRLLSNTDKRFNLVSI
jgi:FlaA1/EpsC-like NDP-sugar epimerase